MHWAIDGLLAGSSRPGYDGETRDPVSNTDVDEWLKDLKQNNIKSIICLLGPDQLSLYNSLPSKLPDYYASKGFQVRHIPVIDHGYPPMTNIQLESVWDAYTALPKPVLIHCSAGQDRTRAALTYIRQKLSPRDDER